MPWDEARAAHTFTLGLADEVGEPVMVPAAEEGRGRQPASGCRPAGNGGTTAPRW
ncbi:hypothetical protein AB0J28_23800 [Streptosporangium canum]|uniref:hypothetical protein n=1 Tax=Streptosporangium canum TaxID=324952 RepID=UPI0034125F93